ncbi:DsbA family protein [Bacteroidales bacterium OttesenSCG-928-M06]|nr:DsbA family protein [Bacteroidales bacterium OttesenSCG-928-M06]
MSTIKIEDSDHIIGSPSAPIVLVEYADYQCPYCGQAYSIIKQLQKKFGDKMAFVFRNYPIQELHPYALHAAIAAETADLQGKFWEMHDIIFEHQRFLDDDSLISYAQRIGLDMEKFKEDFGGKPTINKVEKDMETGNKAGVQGTPAFYVNGKYFTGNWTTPEFMDYIESFLSE